MQQPTGYGVVLVTVGSQQEAQAIAQAVVEAQLVAAVSLSPIQSIYRWQGEIHNKHEWQLVMKTNLALFPTLEAKIREMHSYQLPEIIALPILLSSPAYQQWINEQVQIE
ncbi:divalent-cation tolerance protein CutA [Sphaerospermopsis aphanizomenoides BCCUSP55]|uniref:divalent-cation tolerance protein CutA n=1 Tax=Sphaerospermopsis aphanizomenoides TaxID=459663 RepID=UPI001903A945|nr:divalent-cation tolerance protein CutA [Sphaerospermopsis aphanizomenoides]MBK1987851.1 divalent-cation tolerance protein CutA [Sphaerospermopsis aphanizomenoides BCCUSP55]